MRKVDVQNTGMSAVASAEVRDASTPTKLNASGPGISTVRGRLNQRNRLTFDFERTVAAFKLHDDAQGLRDCRLVADDGELFGSSRDAEQEARLHHVVGEPAQTARKTECKPKPISKPAQTARKIECKLSVDGAGARNSSHVLSGAGSSKPHIGHTEQGRQHVELKRHGGEEVALGA